MTQRYRKYIASALALIFFLAYVNCKTGLVNIEPALIIENLKALLATWVAK